MRTEYTIKITDTKGKAQFSVYPKLIAEEKAQNAKMFYEPKGYTVEFFKVLYNGSSLYKADKIF